MVCRRLPRDNLWELRPPGLARRVPDHNPLDVKLYEIEKVETDHTGKMNLKISHRRDLHIPLEPSESLQLAEKLEQLIPERELQRRKS